jgi:hypothetical protein
MIDSDVSVELRAWRNEFARSHGYDIRKMAAALRERDIAAEPRLVRGEPRLPAAARMSNKPLQPTGAAFPGSPSAKPIDAAPAAEL